MRRHLVTLAIIFSVPASVLAQGPAPATAAKPAAAAKAEAPAHPAVPADVTYTYEPAGRRDPFKDLMGGGGSEPQLTSQKTAEGPAGYPVADLSVRGVMQGRDGFIAMVQAPDKKTYLVHQGDKFLDGVIKAITAQGLVVVQDVHDPLSLVKQREVRKPLRSLEGAKP